MTLQIVVNQERDRIAPVQLVSKTKDIKMWTQFWDMHSGGGTKVEPFDQIFIEAAKDEAIVIFYNRFGRNPNRVSCTCCGNDYSISEYKTLKEATAFQRGCASVMREKYNEKDGKGWDQKYVELPYKKLIPKGYKLNKGYGEYQTLEQYLKNKDVLVVGKEKIKKSERIGSVPEEGYIWRD